MIKTIEKNTQWITLPKDRSWWTKSTNHLMMIIAILFTIFTNARGAGTMIADNIFFVKCVQGLQEKKFYEMRTELQMETHLENV